MHNNAHKWFISMILGFMLVLLSGFALSTYRDITIAKIKYQHCIVD